MAEVDDVVAAAVSLEHRLTKMEQALVANTNATQDMAGRVREQNGRIGKLERFQAQLLVLGIAASFFSPLIFGSVFFVLTEIYK